jgi:ABC-type lipopolysaccharide export system ATPase subunit
MARRDGRLGLALAGLSTGSINLDEADLTHLAARDRVDHGLVRGFQTVRLMERETLFDNELVGCERLPQPGLLAQMFNLPGQRLCRRRDLDAGSVALRSLGLLANAHRTVAGLPFAARRLTEIARMLLVWPKVMLLDEPAAGLDAAERRRVTEKARNPERFPELIDEAAGNGVDILVLDGAGPNVQDDPARGAPPVCAHARREPSWAAQLPHAPVESSVESRTLEQTMVIASQQRALAKQMEVRKGGGARPDCFRR